MLSECVVAEAEQKTIKPARVSFTPEPAQATSAFATTSAQATFAFGTTAALVGSSVRPSALKAGEMLYRWESGEGFPLVLRFCTRWEYCEGFPLVLRFCTRWE
jgi:hypothetical protein